MLISGSFYQLALTKKIIYEINNNGNTRQTMINNVIRSIEKIGNNSVGIFYPINKQISEDIEDVINAVKKVIMYYSK